nr:hypothetical protein [uncultured Noviherbaspirillum sp.]
MNVLAAFLESVLAKNARQVLLAVVGAVFVPGHNIVFVVQKLLHGEYFLLFVFCTEDA